MHRVGAYRLKKSFRGLPESDFVEPSGIEVPPWFSRFLVNRQELPPSLQRSDWSFVALEILWACDFALQRWLHRNRWAYPPQRRILWRCVDVVIHILTESTKKEKKKQKKKETATTNLFLLEDCIDKREQPISTIRTASKKIVAVLNSTKPCPSPNDSRLV